MKTTSSLVLASACALALGGCDGGSNPSGGAKGGSGGPTSIYGKSVQMAKDTREQMQQSGEQANQAAGAIAGGAGLTEIAGLQWAIPAGWENAGASGMRIAEYRLAGGQISVKFFSIQGGVQPNIDRWIGQVRDPLSPPVTKVITAGAFKVHTLAVTGTYGGMGPGGAPMPPQANTRFLGAIVEGGPQPVQVTLIGPESAIEGEVERSWGMMLAGIQPR